MLPSDIRGVLITHQIKLLGMTKIFTKTFMGMICLNARREYVSTSEARHKA